tara:strand:- start:923 stop:1177 length:255 start_codon:yes stop_codon:yes gene_type:complete
MVKTKIPLSKNILEYFIVLITYTPFKKLSLLIDYIIIGNFLRFILPFLQFINLISVYLCRAVSSGYMSKALEPHLKTFIPVSGF